MSTDERDPRRCPTAQDIALLYERANGRCQRCGRELGSDYHNAHLVAHRNGGATTVDNMEAWCAACNLRLGAHDATPDEVELREWQQAALPTVLERLFQTGSATVQAAPGAGKTIFAGTVFRALRNAGYVDRLVVVVPTRALCAQWRRELSQLRIHLDAHPRQRVVERTGLAGLVVTYQSLPTTARMHAVRQRRHATLVILDEVHHVAEYAAWDRALRRMVGDVVGGELETRAVLNLTGTLFRSDPSRRISTVRYQAVRRDGEPALQAIADWTVPTRELIRRGELRAPDLYIYSGRATLADVRAGREINADIADLDRSQREMVLSTALCSPKWLRGFAREAVRLLNLQLGAIGHAEPLKLLFLAPTAHAARLAARELDHIAGVGFARLVISEEPSALETLRLAANEPRPCAIVTVRMITEGFDCPHIATIAHGTNISAPLFLSQMMARAMRLTPTEVREQRPLPTQLLIPDHAELRAAFSRVLSSILPTVDSERDTTGDSTLGTIPWQPRYELLDLGGPHLREAVALDQEEPAVRADELRVVMTDCRTVRLPPTYAVRAALVQRRARARVRPSPHDRISSRAYAGQPPSRADDGDSSEPG